MSSLELLHLRNVIREAANDPDHWKQSLEKIGTVLRRYGDYLEKRLDALEQLAKKR